jgi:putative ABC transport system permease protein
MSYTSHAQSAGEKSLRLATMEIGSKFVSQFKVNVVAGDSLGPDSWSRRYPVLMLNEAAVTSLGFKNPTDAVGKFIETKNGRGRKFENEVVGVMENFHQSSLKDDFTPIVFHLSDPNSTSHYLIKVNGNNLTQTIAQVEKTYKAVYPASAFDYFFLDDFFNEQYKAEQHFGQVFSLFAGFAIFVACMGLFGLTLITITQRIKEIGIRKVLGASIPNILLLISKDFTGLIIMANVIALPFVYWGSHTWLQGYAFRISLSAWYFVIPMLMVFFIALLTISYQAIKAALANPVKSLRTE